jgi:threonine aldolase
MPPLLTSDQRQALRRACATVVPGFAQASAADDFRQLADWCQAHEIKHDLYGQGPLVEDFERKLATLLGQPAAVFMPSGIMAQQAAVRIWAEAAALPRFGVHPTSHLLHHEAEAHAALLQGHAVPVGDGLRPLTAADLADCHQPLACLIAELPIREAGGQLPSWDELQALKAAAQARGIRLHMDGARLWESAAFYDRPHAEIAAGFDSVYVSLYKGIGGFAGAVLAGDEGFIEQARLWRKRLGGTLFHLSPMVAAAAMRFDARLALMPALYQRALDLATGLRGLPRLRVNPATPQSNLMHLFFDAGADAVHAARDHIATEAGTWLFDRVAPADVPGFSRTELYLGDRALQADLGVTLAGFEELSARLSGK